MKRIKFSNAVVYHSNKACMLGHLRLSKFRHAQFAVQGFSEVPRAS